MNSTPVTQFNLSGTRLIGDLQLEGSTRIRVSYMDPWAFRNCAVLTPEEHEELAPATHIEQVVAKFKDDEETVSLYNFLARIDRACMSRSVDLMIWVRRWQAA